MRLIDADNLIVKFDKATENYKADHDYDIENDPFSDGIMSAMFSVNIMVSCAQTIQAISLAKIKQAREKIDNIEPLDFIEITNQIGSNGQEMETSKKFAIAILDKLIAESEGANEKL